eukprot:358851-Chlamydomonas_euryale.AAC.2
MSANLSNQVTRRLTSPGFDWASAGRSGPVFSRPAALRPANRQASGVGNLGTKQRSLDNTQRNRNAANGGAHVPRRRACVHGVPGAAGRSIQQSSPRRAAAT